MHNRYGLRAVIVMLLLALACRIGLAQIGPRYVLDMPAGASGGGAATAVAPTMGQVRLLGQGRALIRFQDIEILAISADAGALSENGAKAAWPAADLLLVTQSRAYGYGGPLLLAAAHHAPLIVAEQEGASAPPAGSGAFYALQTWDALHLRKGKTRLRVTALPGRAGTLGVAGFMLELGNVRGSYRVYVSADNSLPGDAAGLAELAGRLPGANLVLLQGGASQQLALMRHAASSDNDTLLPLVATDYAFKPLRR